MNQFAGQTAVIIGGGSGVGRGVAMGLASEKMNVVVADLDINSAKAVSDELERLGHKAIAVKVNATSTESLKDLAEKSIHTFGAIHILVSTVGAILEKKIEDATDEEWKWMIELNLMANVRAAQVYVPYLKKSENSHIVLTGSGGGLFAPPPEMHIGLYSVIKHALTGFAKSLRNELKEFGIGVSLLIPSGVVGKLATTSALSRSNYLKVPFDDTKGKQPSNRVLESSEAMGALVISALKRKQFLISNKPVETLAAFEKEYGLLKQDLQP
jgi:NAD(P)-dependent dehydrogenase (short-subunit alcohol dehydrogenase family)